MKEKEFMKKYGISIQVPTYYTTNKYGHIDVDEKGMKDVFDKQLKKIVKDVNKALEVKR